MFFWKSRKILKSVIPKRACKCQCGECKGPVIRWVGYGPSLPHLAVMTGMSSAAPANARSKARSVQAIREESETFQHGSNGIQVQYC